MKSEIFFITSRVSNDNNFTSLTCSSALSNGSKLVDWAVISCVHSRLKRLYLDAKHTNRDREKKNYFESDNDACSKLACTIKK